MKNQYFGDKKDYLKYGLLRILADAGQLSIGICWMLTQDDGRTDGQFIRYLREPRKWRAFDPGLFDHLHQAVIVDGTRSVQFIQGERIMPRTAFWDKLLGDSSEERTMYFQG
jgi:hypothetical protein